MDNMRSAYSADFVDPSLDDPFDDRDYEDPDGPSPFFLGLINAFAISLAVVGFLMVIAMVLASAAGV